jgi:hypothetical protein
MSTGDCILDIGADMVGQFPAQLKPSSRSWGDGGTKAPGQRSRLLLDDLQLCLRSLPGVMRTRAAVRARLLVS